MSAYRNFMDYHIERLRDTEDAKTYLTVALDDYEKNGDIEAFLLAVRDVAEAQGGMSRLAERVSLTREGLYKALSENGNPKLNTMGEILHGLGFRFSIEAREKLSTTPQFHARAGQQKESPFRLFGNMGDGDADDGLGACH